VKLIAKKNVKLGDVCVILWKRYCRPAIVNDYKTMFFSGNDAKKGKLVEVLTKQIGKLIKSK